MASIAVMMAEMEAARAFDVEQDWEVAEAESTMDTAQKYHSQLVVSMAIPA